MYIPRHVVASFYIPGIKKLAQEAVFVALSDPERSLFVGSTDVLWAVDFSGVVVSTKATSYPLGEDRRPGPLLEARQYVVGPVKIFLDEMANPRRMAELIIGAAREAKPLV